MSEPKIEYRLVARNDANKVLAATPWIEVPTVAWLADRAAVQTRLEYAASDHTPENFINQFGIPASDIEWRLI